MLVVGGISGLAIGMRRGRRRRGRPRDSDPEAVPEVPVTRITGIRPGPFATREEAEEWLRQTTDGQDAGGDLVDEALAVLNRALHAHRLATHDPYAGGASEALAIGRRIGFGNGDELADGRWEQARELPPSAGRRSRAEALRPQERLAAALGGREPVAACETLVLRARADLDGRRVREAALQLRVGLEALLAEVEADAPTEGTEPLAADQAEAQIADLAELEERRAAVGAAANEALAGELSDTRADEVADTLRMCERVLRRRRILAD